MLALNWNWVSSFDVLKEKIMPIITTLFVCVNTIRARLFWIGLLISSGLGLLKLTMDYSRATSNNTEQFLAGLWSCDQIYQSKPRIFPESHSKWSPVSHAMLLLVILCSAFYTFSIDVTLFTCHQRRHRPWRPCWGLFQLLEMRYELHTKWTPSFPGLDENLVLLRASDSASDVILGVLDTMSGQREPVLQ